MKFFLFFFCVAMIAHPSDEQLLRVLVDGKANGSAKISQKLLEDGSKHIIITMNLGASPNTVKVRQESVYDSLGNPVRKIQEVIDGKGQRQNLVIVTFDKSGANVSVNRGGKPQTSTVPLTSGAPRANPSEFWFIKSRPAIGTRIVYYRFDVAASKWTLAEAKYIGPKTVDLAGKKVAAHLVDSGSEGQAFLDDKGNPLIVITGKIRMEQVKPT